MKKLKQLTSAVALILVFTVTAFAGIIETPAVPPPPPPPPESSSSVAAPGGMETPGVTQGPGLASDSVTEVALSLLQSVLSVF
jgi:hypothetical protein